MMHEKATVDFSIWAVWTGFDQYIRDLSRDVVGRPFTSYELSELLGRIKRQIQGLEDAVRVASPMQPAWDPGGKTILFVPNSPRITDPEASLFREWVNFSRIRRRVDDVLRAAPRPMVTGINPGIHFSPGCPVKSTEELTKEVEVEFARPVLSSWHSPSALPLPHPPLEPRVSQDGARYVVSFVSKISGRTFAL